ncbi:hypothetical protein GGR52DRAFT_521791 [Hypoxylon sp. FL1284]|nr:hypothetical protein GGR52DRAFT_521791 [Hypoxylon sp. FL1284]
MAQLPPKMRRLRGLILVLSLAAGADNLGQGTLQLGGYSQLVGDVYTFLRTFGFVAHRATLVGRCVCTGMYV